VIGLEKDQLLHLRSLTQSADTGYQEKSDQLGWDTSDEFRNFLMSHFELIDYLFELCHKEFPGSKIDNLVYYAKSILQALFKSGRLEVDNFRKWAKNIVPALNRIVFPEIGCGPDKISSFPDITLFLIEKDIVQLKPSEIGEYFKFIIPFSKGDHGPEIIVSMGGLPAFTFNQLKKYKDRLLEVRWAIQYLHDQYSLTSDVLAMLVAKHGITLDTFDHPTLTGLCESEFKLLTQLSRAPEWESRFEASDLVLVRMERSRYLSRYLSSTGGKYKIMFSNAIRPTTHFALNGVVGGHSGGDWEDADVAILVPFQDAIRINRDTFYGGMVVDVIFVGYVRFPDSCIILRKKKTETSSLFRCRIMNTIIEKGFFL
jgi:hypothetical protein